MPNQYNIYIYSFVVCGMSTAALFLIERSIGMRDAVHKLLFGTAIFTLLFGFITLLSRVSRRDRRQKKAHPQAMKIIHELEAHAGLNDYQSVARVVELVQNTYLANLRVEDIYRLYELVPADYLPRTYRPGGPTLDWHKFDLCIVAAKQDMPFASQIVEELLKHHRNLRIYIDDEPEIEPQNNLLKRNYYSGSRLCLALISVHLKRDERKKRQLNLARQRELEIRKKSKVGLGFSTPYLKPIALDEEGLLFMRAIKDLAPFVEHFSVIEDRKILFKVVVHCMLEELRKYYPPDPSESRETNVNLMAPADRPHRVFISHSSKDKEFARRLYDDLQARGVDCWFAPIDMRIGASIRDAIEEAFRPACKLLPILSENSINSPWVGNEVEVALEKERTNRATIICPIRIDDSIHSAKPAWARTLRRQRHIGDFTDWEDPGAYENALKSLLQALKPEKESVDYLLEGE